MAAAPQRLALAGVVVGRLTLLGLWFAGISLLANHLGQEALGVYALCVAYIQLFTSFIADTLDLAVLRRVPMELVSDPPRAFGVLRSAFIVRLGLGLAVWAGTVAFSPSIAEAILDGPVRWPLIALAGTGIIGDLLFRSAMVYFQAAGRFRRLLLLDAALQGGRFVAILVLMLTGLLDAPGAVLTHVAIPFLVFLLALPLLPRQVLRRGPSGHREILDVMHYGKWMILAFAVAALSERIELFLVGWFLDAAAAGVYFTALILAARMPELLEGAMATVLMPQVTQAHARGHFRTLQGTYVRWAVGPAAAVVLGVLWLGAWAIPLFFSDKYMATVPLVQGMMVGAMVWLALAPLASSLVAFHAPRAMLAINLGGLALRGVAGIAVIPWLGLAGAAVIFVAVKLAMTTAVVAVALRLSRPQAAAEASTAPVLLRGEGSA